jgi:CubicO group peptidase (beta-lactamase class C family)
MREKIAMNRSHRIVSRKLLTALILVVALVAFVGATSVGRYRPAIALKVASGLVSHQICSSVFVSHLDASEEFREIVPTLGPLRYVARYDIDWQQRSVSARIAGMAYSHALYRQAEGCIVLVGITPKPPAVIDEPDDGSTIISNALPGAGVVKPVNSALGLAIDEQFEEPQNPPHRWTRAVVIVKDGHIVGERYANGIGPQTPLLGWSMSKSVINALLGILVRQGRLSPEAPANVGEWADPKDPRHSITVDQLMRMKSGTNFGDSLEAGFLSGFDPTKRMLFTTSDMASYAAQAKLAAAPGMRWKYSDGSYLILSRILRDRVGGDTQSVLNFAHRELFDRLGMEKPVIEFDATGTPVGSSYIFATARDWARLGQLYAQDGVVGGQRILPESWVDYSSRLTPGSEDYGYGAGFWTNRGNSDAAHQRVAAGMPSDSFMARGSYGQYVLVSPSQRLVIVRLGTSYTRAGDLRAMERLTSTVVRALSPSTRN